MMDVELEVNESKLATARVHLCLVLASAEPNQVQFIIQICLKAMFFFGTTANGSIKQPSCSLFSTQGICCYMLYPGLLFGCGTVVLANQDKTRKLDQNYEMKKNPRWSKPKFLQTRVYLNLSQQIYNIFDTFVDNSIMLLIEVMKSKHKN